MTVLNVTQKLSALLKRRAIALGALAAAALGGLTACDDKDVPPSWMDPDETGRTYLSMIITTGAEPTSRADDGANGWGDPYNDEDGTGIENRIDPGKVHVAVFDARTGASLGVASTTGNSTDVLVQPISKGTGLYNLYFDITDMGLQRGRDYVAAVVVNTANPPAGPTIDSDYVFTLQTLTGGNPGTGADYYANGLLPMFGFVRWNMGEFKFPQQNPGYPSVGTVELMRSVCKIEVKITDDPAFTNAPFMHFAEDELPRLAYAGRHVNRSGYVTPKRQHWIKQGKNTTRDLTFAESHFENSSTRWNQNNPQDHVVFSACSPDKRSYYIYLPEASGQSMRPNAQPLRLNVVIVFDDPDPSLPDDSPLKHRRITGTLFPSLPYTGAPATVAPGTDYTDWKLVRNHIYRFTLTDFIDETGLQYQVNEIKGVNVFVPDFD